MDFDANFKELRKELEFRLSSVVNTWSDQVGTNDNPTNKKLAKQQPPVLPSEQARTSSSADYSVDKDREITRILSKNPSLQPILEETVQQQYSKFSTELETHPYKQEQETLRAVSEMSESSFYADDHKDKLLTTLSFKYSYSQINTPFFRHKI